MPFVQQIPSNNVADYIPFQEKIRYVAIGDSYSIGEGIDESGRFPNILTKHLQKRGIFIDLIANPSHTGWTTKDAIEKELPVFNESNPNFATLLIGVNDWVQKVDEVTYRKNLRTLIEGMLQKLPSPDRLILITIPDFSAGPEGQKYGGGRNISKGIAEFNTIIKEEAAKHGCPLVDIYSISQGMKDHPALIAKDGLHPSAKEYELWEELIFPVAYTKIKPR